MSAVKIDGKHVEASGVSFELSNTGKVLFPDDGLTKGELVEYYARSRRDAAVPEGPAHRHGPVSRRHHQAADLPEEPGQVLPGLDHQRRGQEGGGTLRHVVCDKAATLLYLANQAVIEFHVFLSRVDSLECADQVVVDFDPPDNDGFDQARQCALWLRSLLEDELGLTSYVKTTRGKGLHVHVPLNRKQGFEETRTFAREAFQVLAARHPDVVTVEQRVQARGTSTTRTSCATPTPRPSWPPSPSAPPPAPTWRPRCAGRG